jgi:hypothetical protein
LTEFKGALALVCIPVLLEVSQEWRGQSDIDDDHASIAVFVLIGGAIRRLPLTIMRRFKGNDDTTLLLITPAVLFASENLFYDPGIQHRFTFLLVCTRSSLEGNFLSVGGLDQ